MKIKDSYILSEIGDENLLINTGGGFKGVVRINNTARFIVECLCKEDTTKESLVEQMSKKYDANRDELAESVDITLETLRKIGALVE